MFRFGRYLMLAATLALTLPTAEAGGGYGHRSYGHHGYYGRHHGHGGGNYRRGGHGRALGYAVGGLIAGGVLASVLNTPYYQPTPVPAYRPTYPAPNLAGPVFIREANGLCYLQSYNRQGQTVLSPAPISNCE